MRAPDRRDAPVRVLHVLTRYATGGSERRVADVVEALPGPEFDHRVAIGRDSIPERARAAFGDARVLVVRDLVREPDPLRDARAFAQLVRLMRRGRFDVVHTVQSKAGILGRLAARRAGTRVVLHALTMANFGPGFGRLGAAYRAAERLAARWTDAYSVVGTDLRDRYLAAGIADPGRFRIIRSSIALDRFAEAARVPREQLRAGLGVPADALVVAHVGALEPRKRVDLLPAVAQALRARAGRPVVVLVAGDGELRDRLAEDVRRRALDGGVRLLGYTDRVPEVIAASDALVLLSEAEGVPQVLVQAATAGTPFATTPVDGSGELLGIGAAGVVLDSLGPADIAEGIARAAELGASPVAGERLASWRRERVLQDYRDLYRDALDGR